VLRQGVVEGLRGEWIFQFPQEIDGGTFGGRRRVRTAREGDPLVGIEPPYASRLGRMKYWALVA